MSLEEQLRSIGKRTFVKCFATAHAAHFADGKITDEQVAECDDSDSDNWSPTSLRTKVSVIRKIFEKQNQCEALRMCFRNKKHPETELDARELHAQFCKK